MGSVLVSQFVLEFVSLSESEKQSVLVLVSEKQH